MAESAQIKKVSWWQERLADWLIANPQLKLHHAAREFNCSPSWISIVKNSDAFKAYFAERSGQASDVILLGIKERLTSIAETSLELIEEKLETDGKVMHYDDLLDTSSMALKALGYGASAKSAPAPTQVNVNVVTADLLAEARARRAQELAGRQSQDLPSAPLPQISSTKRVIDLEEI